ncbi:MAG TPA: glycoside hydrolase family 1 protein [Candidatus Obscuribacterales bacterium]
MKIRAFLVCCLLVLNACAGARPAPAIPAERFLKFPDGFLWGTATAAYQVEGGISNNWSAAGVDAGQAVDHYTRYEADFDQARKLGTNAYRMSIEWARIEPERGKYDQGVIAHYRQMLKALRQRGIAPMVTVFHFTLPVWFDQKGGFTRQENIPDFIRFVSYVAREFKDEVEWWNTVNEPLVYSFKSFDEGSWPPYKKDRNLALRVARNLMIAHGKAYRAIHAEDPIAWVGYAHNTTLLQPNWPLNPLDQLMTNVQSYLFNEAFWDAIQKGEMDFRAPGIDPVQIAYDRDLKGSMDFIGINYYTRYLVTASGAPITRPGVPVSDLNWEIYPEGMLQVLRMANRHAQAMKIPIIITENGIADAGDQQRPKYLVDHLSQIWQAVHEGIPVMGYFHWTLMDNFEWADGYKARFGLMDNERKWRPSAYLYQKIATANGFPGLWLSKLPETQP